jgi:hypothetical protein
MRLKRPHFHVDAGGIRITNCHDDCRSVVLIVVAVVLAALPLTRPYFPKGTYFAFEDGDAGPALWLFGIFASLSSAFWWSTVVIDLGAREVTVRRRWGLLYSVSCRKLTFCRAVVVRGDDDGRANVALDDPEDPGGSEVNYSKALVWGRRRAETEAIARRLAEFLKLPLKVCRRSGWQKLGA